MCAISSLKNPYLEEIEVLYEEEAEEEPGDDDPEDLFGGKHLQALGSIEATPWLFHVVSIGFGRTMLQLYCGVLNAPHNMFLSNGSKWPRVFTT